MLTTLVFFGAVILVVVAWLQIGISERNLHTTESHIHEALDSKGRVLATNHAIALKSLVLDNAFTPMRELVGQAIDEDEELIYGLFLSAEGIPWAFVSPASPIGEPERTGKLDPNAWRVLGLPKEDLVLKSLTISERRLFGLNILEFAMPIEDEGELLGTIRYGISTQRMETALTDAKARSATALNRTLVILGGIVLLMVALMMLLSFQSAARIIKPINELGKAALELAAGNRDVRVEVSSGDELEQLADTFNAMVADLKISYEQLQELNRTLERRVEERTMEATERSEAMRLVLDHVDQGLVTLTPDGFLGDERSAAFKTWFPRVPEDDSLAATLGRNDEDRKLLFELCWESVANPIIPLELALDQVPSHIEVGGSHYALGYKPVLVDDTLQSVLLVVTDVTQELEQIAATRRQQEFISVFERVMNDRDEFIEFLNEAERLITRLVASARSDRVGFLRDLHTLKGTTGVFGVDSVSACCDELESALCEAERAVDPDEVQRLRSVWLEFSERAERLIAGGSERRVELSHAELDRLVQDLDSGRPTDEAAAFLESLKGEPTSLRFRRISHQITGLAERLGKCEVDVEILHNDVRLSAERWAPFWSAFTHIVRNAVDHGLETAAQRETVGKPAAGKITLRSSTLGGYHEIELADDGRGVDWDKIRTRAAALDLPHATSAELQDAVFADGLTSRDDITHTSGRGVGMSAIRAVCLAMGGELDIQSPTPGKGTRLTFRIPVSLSAEPVGGLCTRAAHS
jgi:two-component system chemotaxis sensor kinase CheA